MKHPFILSACAALACLASCERHTSLPAPRTLFRTVGEGTRSVLTAGDIETRKTCITLAAYHEDRLFSAGYFDSDLDMMPLNLEEGIAYTVYALVNMGDLTTSLPASESALETWTWDIPSYLDGDTSLETRGLPMAGKSSCTAGSESHTVIPVRRLLAKVTARLSCDWPGAVIRNVKVCNLNRSMCPFGTASALDASDILSETEFEEGTGGASGTFVFYVPENCQGSIPDITDSPYKSPDGNASVAEIQDRLTYLETVVDGSGLYEGTVTYRSYLGENATTDFNLRGNACYLWSITYYEDGLQQEGWKWDNGLTDNRYLEFLQDTVFVEAGDAVAYPDILRSNLSLGDILKTFSGDDAASIIDTEGTEAFTVSASATEGLTCLLEARPVRNPTAALTVSTVIQVKVKEVVEITRTLEITPAEATLSAGYTKTYKAILHTVTIVNGTIHESSSVTLANTDLTWSSSDTAVATVNAAGAVTGVSPGTVTILAILNSDTDVRATALLTVTSGTGGIDDGWDDEGEQELD